MKRRGGKREGAGWKKLLALAKITRAINKINIGEQISDVYTLYFENRVFSTWGNVRAKGTLVIDSDFASWLLGLEFIGRQEQS